MSNKSVQILNKDQRIFITNIMEQYTPDSNYPYLGLTKIENSKLVQVSDTGFYDFKEKEFLNELAFAYRLSITKDYDEFFNKYLYSNLFRDTNPLPNGQIQYFFEGKNNESVTVSHTKGNKSIKYFYEDFDWSDVKRKLINRNFVMI